MKKQLLLRMFLLTMSGADFSQLLSAQPGFNGNKCKEIDALLIKKAIQ